MHEFIHAWGFQHEHARPDRSSYITVNLDNTDNDEQFVTLDGGSWRDSDFPYETQSVMHYCSTCGTNGKGPVMTYHDGSFFDSGQFMTTTDALQIQWSYCREKDLLESKILVYHVSAKKRESIIIDNLLQKSLSTKII